MNTPRAEDAAVRHERGRAAPHVPVEAGFHGLFRISVGLGRAAELSFDVVDLADDAVAYEFAGHTELFAGTLLGAGLQDALIATHGVDEGERLVDVVGERLFTIDVFASIQCSDGDEGVPMVRRGDDDGVDVLALQQLAEVGIGFTTFEAGIFVLAIAFFDSLFGEFSAVGIDVADGHDLDFFAAQEAAEVTAVHFTHADESECEALAWSGIGAPDA